MNVIKIWYSHPIQKLMTSSTNSIVQVSTLISRLFPLWSSLNFSFSRPTFGTFSSHFSIELWLKQISFRNIREEKNCGHESAQNGIDELKRKRKKLNWISLSRANTPISLMVFSLILPLEKCQTWTNWKMENDNFLTILYSVYLSDSFYFVTIDLYSHITFIFTEIECRYDCENATESSIAIFDGTYLHIHWIYEIIDEISFSLTKDSTSSAMMVLMPMPMLEIAKSHETYSVYQYLHRIWSFFISISSFVFFLSSSYEVWVID